MKILIIDDQRLVLIPLERRLELEGYEVLTIKDSSAWLSSLNTFNPDLLILDINMPNVSGLDIITKIRTTNFKNLPIAVLSGNLGDDIIKKCFQLGVNEYMRKPLSINELCVRVNRILGKTSLTGEPRIFKNALINNRCVGIVIPTYNEADRLSSPEYINFIDKHPEYHMCFVNDGSTDDTLSVLKQIQKGREEFISVYNCEKNSGKSEAVRLGMLHMSKYDDLDYIGFLDADLSTDLFDFDELANTIFNSDFKVVSGSRINRMGAIIKNESSRKIFSAFFNCLIRKVLLMNFKDTQCGAKIFNKDIIQILFKDKFVSKWLFDVEIYLRMRRYFGLNRSKNMICEKPLKRWVYVSDSKISYNEIFNIILELPKIVLSYRVKSQKSYKIVEPVYEKSFLKPQPENI